MTAVQKKILIVEDELAQSEILKLALEKENFSILQAKNGEEGLKLALEHHPDLILLDMVMPVMNGLDLIKEIRKDEWGKQVKIIVLTNSPDLKNVQQSMEDEVFDYFIKSDTPIELIVSKVKEVLE